MSEEGEERAVAIMARYIYNGGRKETHRRYKVS